MIIVINTSIYHSNLIIVLLFLHIVLFHFFNHQFAFLMLSQENLSLAYQKIESLLDNKTFSIPHAKIIEKRSWFSYFSGKSRKSNFKNNLQDYDGSRNKKENKNISNNFDDEWMYSVKLGVIDINRMLNKFENKQYEYQDNHKKKDHNQYMWRVCGRISSTDQHDKKNEDSNKRKTIRVRNLKDDTNGNHGNEADSVGPDLGYTCGLWLLLHYYTGEFMYICTRVHKYLVNMYICIYVYIYIYIYTHICMYICLNIHSYMCVFINVCISVFIYMYLHI
jgi:hypothetical protein